MVSAAVGEEKGATMRFAEVPRCRGATFDAESIV